MISASVIIPAFNRIEPLRYTLHSAATALARLPGGGEILLVDDGSDPALEAQLAGLDQIPGLRHLRQANQGSMVARLAGLQAARGDIVLFLDSDDLIHPDKLRRHAELFAGKTVDLVYDDMAVATLLEGHSASFAPDSLLPVAASASDLLLCIQPAPHNPTYRREYLCAALAAPVVPPRRAFDPAGDLWLYYNLLLHPFRFEKIPAALTAVGPHDEVRYSQHWEKLGVAALLVAEEFLRRCPATPDTAAARRAVGEAAFRSWRALPRDFDAGYGARLLALWDAAPRGPAHQLGGRGFVLLARLIGPAAAGHWLRRRNQSYASCRTLTDDELRRLLAAT